MAEAKILIVDDDTGNCENLSDIFQEKGFSVGTANTIREAIDEAKKTAFDVALVDINLPDGKGMSILREFKKNYPERVCFVISGNTSFQDAIEAFEEGARGYFVKPLIMKDVIARVEEALGRLYVEETLKERQKELRCLYSVTHDIQEKLSIDKLCRRIIKHLISAMQFPDITVPVIELNNRRFTSKGYTEEINHGLHADIKSRGKAYGHLWVCYTEDRAFLIPEEQNLINFIAEDLALWIERYQAEGDLMQGFKKLRRTLEQTIHVLASTIEKRDQYTAGHQRRLANLASAIAKELGLPEEEINAVNMAGLIHDIGKISIPAEVLSKPTALSRSEIELIKCHPRICYDIIKEIEFPWPLAQIILQHHERIDGSGYPKGLTREDISLEARILAVSDVVGSMAAPSSPYRPSLGLEKAQEEITKNKGVLYDPEVVDVCLKLFREKKFEFRLKERKRAFYNDGEGSNSPSQF